MESLTDDDWAASGIGGDSPSSPGKWLLGPSFFLLTLAASAPASALMPGTGGALTPATFRARSEWVSVDSTNTEAASREIDHPAGAPGLSIKERLETLKASLGLTMTDLADLFCVARPSVYSWLKGQEPRPDKLARLSALEDAAETIASLHLERTEKLIKRPLKCGGTLYSRIREGAPLDDALAEIAEVSRVESRQRRLNKGRYDRMSAREAADVVSNKGFGRDS